MKRALFPRLVAVSVAAVLYVQPLAAVLWTAPTTVSAIAPTSVRRIAPTSDRGIAPTSATEIAPTSVSASAPPSFAQDTSAADPSAPVTVFAPARFTRTTGAPNEFTRTMTVPAWVIGPFSLRVDNGAAAGGSRVSSANVWIDGTQVVAPSDLNQNVPSLTRRVTLTARSTLRVRLASQPGSYLTLSITGTNGDRSAPQLTIAEPTAANLNTASPRIVVRYADPAGSGDPAASGLVLDTLRISIDGVTRTGEFARTATEATAALVLGEGAHTIDAQISDVAGNVGPITAAFRIDVTPPTIRVATPDSNAYVPVATPAIRVDYGDEVALDAGSLEIRINGIDRTALFARTASSATATLPPDAALADGTANVSARIRDAAGNEATSSILFNVDTIAPRVVIVEPGNAQFTAATQVDVRGGVVDASPVTVRVEGIEGTVAGSEFLVTGVPVGAPPQVALRAVATDAAGHTGDAVVTLRIDRDPPSVSFTSPAPDAYLKGPIVEVSGAVSDASPVIVTVNGEPAAIAGGSFTGAIAAQDGALALRAVAVDAAGNTAAADLSVSVDTVPPVLTITEPAPELITGQARVRLAGTASDSSPFSVRVGGADVPVMDGAFATDVALPGEGSNTLFVTAEDRAGNETTVDVSVIADRTAPQLAIVSPDDESIVANLPFSVQGSVVDITSVEVLVDGTPADVTGSGWSHTVGAAADGNRTVTAIATDAAGNRSTRTRSFLLDTTPPVVTILSPDAGALTNAGSVNVNGTVTDLTLRTVTVNGAPVDLAPTSGSAIAPTNGSGLAPTSGSGFAPTSDSGLAPTSFSVSIPLDEGENHVVVIATDATGRSGESEVHLTRDSTPPSVELNAPERVTRRRPGEVTVDAPDPDVVRVDIAIDGSPLVGLTSPPYRADLVIPVDAKPGSELLVSATATDRAGNTAQASQLVRVAGDGAIVGQVLADVTGQPLPGATVTYAPIGANSVAGAGFLGAPKLGTSEGGSRPDPIETDERGRYSFASADTAVRIAASAPDMTGVTRDVTVASETGTVVLDARLTPLAAPVTLGAAERDISLDAHTVVRVPAGAVPDGAELRATPLSGQGLPALLPLGWSPLRAVDLRTAGMLPLLMLRTSGLPAIETYLAQYTADGWILASGPFTADASGTLNVELAPVTSATVGADLQVGPITFALVAPDPDVMVPGIGSVLPALEFVPIPLTATSTGVVDPPTVSPSGGNARGTLAVQSPAPLPSGTVVQTVVTETYSLTDGSVASEEQRTQDLILYRVPPTNDPNENDPNDSNDPNAPNDLTVQFPILPSRTFAVSEIASGTVHLDILAGRESVRGQTGGSEPVTLTSAGATLNVARGALADDTAITFQSTVLSSFLPASADLTPVAEFIVDFSGRTLGTGAAIDVPATAVAPFNAATDTLLIARIERVDSIPKPIVVSLASVSGDRVLSQRRAGMEGLIRGGRYVLYRASMPIGYFAGQATAAGQPARAVIETSTLPFIGVSGPDGRYLAAARTGNLQATARVVRTSLKADATVEITAQDTTALDFALTGAVATASVVPANGAVAVSAGVQIEITAPVAINPATVASASVRLLHLGSATEDSAALGPIDIRLVLSASGRTLAIVPATRLASNARFRLEAAGLADVFGGAIVVPPTTFVTKADEGPVYDVKKLVVSFPDEDGQVTLTGPAQTLPPGSEVLIINNGSGEVSTFPVLNDGSVTGRFFAALTDRLQITITDTLGNVTTFERNTYVAGDGTTSVNEGGGIIEGPSGAEVRVPKGALDPFDVALMRLSAIPQFIFGEIQKAGGLPGLVIAGGVTVESPGINFFTGEVDLAFPKPADAPDGAAYYILRKLSGPDGRMAYETLDFAKVEGEGANAKVVTASPPFPGYMSDYNSFNLGGMDFGLPADSQMQNHAILAWSFDQALPGKSLGGVITGKVLRTKWNPGSPVPTFEPVAGAIVSGVDATGQPLWPLVPNGSGATTVAVSQADGTYALYDNRYEGGPVTVSATRDGETITAIAFEANPQVAKSAALAFARHIATTNLTYPAVQPPQAPTTVDITLTRTVNDVEQIVRDGVVVVQTPVRARFRPDENSKLVEVTINGGAPLALVPDVSRPGEWVLNDAYIPAQPGLYAIVAWAQPPIGDKVPVRLTFRAIAAGGGVSDALPSDAPIVIEGRTQPRRDARGVAITIFPQITFSEPVKGISADTVKLVDPAGMTITSVILGVGPDGLPLGAIASPDAVVTSITLQPLVGLKYSATYTLNLTSGIVDMDDGTNGTAANKPLTPYTTTFTTFAPEGLGHTDEGFTAGGLAIVGDRAYVAQNEGPRTRLRLFDVSDPVAPLEITGPDTQSFALHRPPPVSIVGNPADLVVDDGTAIAGRRLLAVATNPFSMPFIPANVRFYDVNDDQTWHWVGAVTLGKEPQDGLIKRLVMHGTRLYALVAGQGKGVQVIDVPDALNLFSEAMNGEESGPYWDVVQSISVQGRGFGETSIVQTVFLDTGTGLNSLMHDLAVLDMSIDGVTQPIVVATGRNPIAVVNPQTGQVLFNGALKNAAGAEVTSWGYAAEAGFVNEHPIALVSAVPPGSTASGAGHIFAVVDLTNPATPVVSATLTLPVPAAAVNDIVLKGTTAYVGTEFGTYVVSLEEPTQPRLISTITSVGGRLALTDTNLLFGSVRSNNTLQHELGGVRSAALQTMALVRSISASGVVAEGEADVTERDVDIEVTVVPAGYRIATASIEIARDTTPVATLIGTVNGSSATTTWAAKQAVDRKATYTARAVITSPEGEELVSSAARVPLVSFAFVNSRGEESFAPVVSDPYPHVVLEPVATSDVQPVGQAGQYRVRLRGTVTDPVADIVAGGAADITTIRINDVGYPVARVQERSSDLRPYAFRGRFEATIPINAAEGRNHIVVEATNAMGNTAEDSVTIDVRTELSDPTPAPAPAHFDSKFLESYTLVLGTLSGDADALVFYRGAADPTGTEPTLSETGPSTLTFTGTTTDLGVVTVRLTTLPAGPDDPVRATVSSSSLAIAEDEFSFFAISSGVFRSPALRVPSNQRLELTLQDVPDVNSVDHIQVSIPGRPGATASLQETMASSLEFAGDVPELGATTVRVRAVEMTPEEMDLLTANVSSSGLGLESYLLDLMETAPDSRTFASEIAAVVLAPEPIPIVTVATVAGVTNNPEAPAGVSEPVWLVARGLTDIQAGDAITIGDRSFELTGAPPPAATSLLMNVSTAGLVRGVRVKEPLLFVRDVGSLAVRNVLPGIENPDTADHTDVTSVIHPLGYVSPVRRLRYIAITSPVSTSKRMFVRGTKAQVTLSFASHRPFRPSVDGITWSGTGVAGKLLEYQNIATQIGGAWRIKLKLAVDVAINADLGPRDIVVRFGNGDTTTGERSLEVDRRRLVIFAIDGLSKTQFDAAKSDMSPPVLGRSHGTALHRIFQDSVTRGQVVDRELITTFPPITYTRWASVFSGQTPGETRVHANQWFNRHALINGSEFGDVDQRLGLGTAGQVNNVLFSAGAYNRHFDTDLVFDELRRAGLRSIVIGHQVGLGRSMRGERRLSGTGNDEWRRWDPELVAFAAAGTVMGRVAVETGSKIVARAMDGFGSRTAVDEISASHAQFDLMVVYLPGLDHLIHDAGAPDETAREYFADSLHGAINAVVRSLREYQDSTVFAVMSDHGHYATSLDRAIDVDDTGSATGSVSLRRALQPQRRYLVSPTFQDSPGNANVIAVPQFGLANVYVAAGRRTDGRADWTRPPDAQQLEPLVNSLFEQYVRGREWDSRPMADIFVRSPGPTFTGSTYLAVPRNYDPNKMCGEARCGLFGQLVAPDQDHLGQGIGDNFDGNDANWSYIAPAERLARSISANSGDIVLMANGRYGYQFGAAYKAQHGSLTLMDARVPIAFGFGAATGGPNEDTILQPVVRFLQSFTDDYEHLAEAEAIRKFLLPSP